MKLYYFLIIAIGLMYTFHLAGIETGTSRTLDMLTSQNISDTTIDYDVANYQNSSISTLRNSVNQNSWWLSVTIGLAIFTFLSLISGIRIFGSGVDITAIVTAASGAIASVLFTMFALDFFSILLFMNELTGGTGWQFNLTWILIIPILFGFALSLIQFIKGTE